jgi:beta-galactosidase
MVEKKLGFGGLGAAFFPEHHPQETWDEYVRLIAECGLKFVRIGEFAWDKIEPQEGVYEFGWLDDIFGRLGKRGIQALLCTPTAVPPVWACEKYPEMHPEPEDGRRREFGGRRYTCPTSPEYLALCDGVVTALAKHFAKSDQVCGWQLDNEVGHPFCFCDRCHAHFARWAEGRFGTVWAFNDAHTMHYWGQTVARFDQIPFPNTYDHPSLWQSYHRFCSEALIASYRRQVEILRRHGAVAPITTNMMGTWYGYDHNEMAEMLDVVSLDSYAGPEATFTQQAFFNAFYRGLKGNRPMWFNEFQCSRMRESVLPGQTRLATLLQVGQGANRISYFRFDTCPSGNERDVYGMVKPCRQPGRIYTEIQATAHRLDRLAPLLSATGPGSATVAVLNTFPNHAEFARTPKNPEFAGLFGNGYTDHLRRHFAAITGLNVPCDVVHHGRDFSRYRLIIAPGLYILPQDLASQIERYIKAGGNFLMLPFSGYADENAKLWDLPVPGPLSRAFGIRVLDNGDHHPLVGELRLKSTGKMKLPELKLGKWFDEILVDRGTEVLATYRNRFFNGVPAFTRHRLGKGMAYYLGVFPEHDDLPRFYRIFLPQFELAPLLPGLPDGIHVSRRSGPAGDLFFLANDTPETREVRLGRKFRNVETGKPAGTMLKVPGFDVVVLGVLQERNDI